MATSASISKPEGLVAKWSQLQAARWIRAQAKAGNVRFSYHAEHERGAEYEISPDEQLEAIKRGTPKRWEPGENPRTREPNMKMTFIHAQKSRAVGVVVAVSDGDSDVIAVTTWQDLL